MIRELAAQTGAAPWAIASMLLFIVVFAVIALRVLTREKGAYDRQARMPLEDEPPFPDCPGPRG